MTKPAPRIASRMNTVEITGGLFDFPNKKGLASMSTLSSFYGEKEADYTDGVLRFDTADIDRFGDFFLSAGAEKVIHVRDYRGKTIWNFPTTGLSDVWSRFLSCASI